ncbi:hypothetical protein [Haladaptatus sp.]|uniref:hypothetical protein n=1 Tax=Haladaptatus sp. TaxID=1973141 RepID=UPI003C35ED23
MRRRRLLVCGSALLSSGLSGCLGSLNSAGENGEPTTNESTTRTTTRITTDTGTEGLALANSSSKTRKVHVAVSRKSDPTPLVDAKYEVPSGHLLWFSETLEHGQSYRIDAEITGGKSRETTLTAEGCAGDPYNSSGSRPVIIYVGNQKPTIAFKECDVEFPPNRYTTEGTDGHEV